MGTRAPCLAVFRWDDERPHTRDDAEARNTHRAFVESGHVRDDVRGRRSGRSGVRRAGRGRQSAHVGRPGLPGSRPRFAGAGARFRETDGPRVRVAVAETAEGPDRGLTSDVIDGPRGQPTAPPGRAAQRGAARPRREREDHRDQRLRLLAARRRTVFLRFAAFRAGRRDCALLRDLEAAFFFGLLLGADLFTLAFAFGALVFVFFGLTLAFGFTLEALAPVDFAFGRSATLAAGAAADFA